LDLAIGPGGLKSPFAETLLHTSRLDLLFEEIDLTAQRLALLVHGTVMVDLGHKTPVVDGELVECSTKGGEGGTTPPQGG